MTLQEFLSGGNWQAISTYKKTGRLPSYVSKPKTKKYSKGAAGMTLGVMKQHQKSLKKPKKLVGSRRKKTKVKKINY